MQKRKVEEEDSLYEPSDCSNDSNSLESTEGTDSTDEENSDEGKEEKKEKKREGNKRRKKNEENDEDDNGDEDDNEENDKDSNEENDEDEGNEDEDDGNDKDEDEGNNEENGDEDDNEEKNDDGNNEDDNKNGDEEKKEMNDFMNVMFLFSNLNNVKKIENKVVPNKKEKNLKILGPFLPLQKEDREIKFTKFFDSLDELISLGDKYDPGINYICNINMKKLHNITEPLKELNSMIGLKKFKKSIIDQIIYLLTIENKDEIPMLNSCIYGSSGVGKTSIAKILGEIYSSCGILSGNKFKVVKREDFVGEFLGSSAIKTRKLLESCKGGVMFLDEAYSFGSYDSNKDKFAKEAIDTLTGFLSENYKDFILIIAGYEEEMKKTFFPINSGLERRFPYRFTIESYDYIEMKEIFKKFVKDENYSLMLNETELDKFFKLNKENFPCFGGDIKTFLDKCKIYHFRRMILLDKKMWKIITMEDINEGIKSYLDERDIKKEEKIINFMYL